MTETTMPPVLRAVTVRCDVDQAFAVFTERIGEWWPLATHSVGRDRAVTAVLEPGVGGRIFERWADGSERDWGRVTLWEPPRRFAVTWKPNPDRSAPTEYEVRFLAGEGGTRVEIEHWGWELLGDEADEARASYDTGWIPVLDGFVALVG